MPEPTTELQKVAAAIRLGDGNDPAEPIRTVLASQIDVARAVVSRLAPSAPTAVRLQAVIAICGQLYDGPNAAEGMTFDKAIRQSGAHSLPCLLYTSPSPRDS